MALAERAKSCPYCGLKSGHHRRECPKREPPTLHTQKTLTGRRAEQMSFVAPVDRPDRMKPLSPRQFRRQSRETTLSTFGVEKPPPRGVKRLDSYVDRYITARCGCGEALSVPYWEKEGIEYSTFVQYHKGHPDFAEEVVRI